MRLLLPAVTIKSAKDGTTNQTPLRVSGLGESIQHAGTRITVVTDYASLVDNNLKQVQAIVLISWNLVFILV